MKYDSLRSNSSDSDVSVTNGNTISSHNEDIYSGSDENGTIVFSDDPSKVPNRRQKDNKEKESLRSINKTPMGKFNKDEQAVIRSLQKVLTVYCSGNLNDYRKTLLPAFRPEADKLIKENGSNTYLSDMRQQCYREFTANKIFFGRGIPKIAPQTKTASIYFTTSVPIGTEGSNEQTIIEALFAYHNATWKFLFFGSVSGGNYNTDDILKWSKPLALQHGNE
jgi:hypothetical protein